MELTAKGKVQARRAGVVSQRGLLVVAAIFIVLLLAVYFGISTVMADRLSRPERHPLTETPSIYGLTYERVEFTSAVDNIRLEGWYIDSPGSKVIMMLHGWNGNRTNRDTAMPMAEAFEQHGYDVFMFDFRGHGESGGDRFSLGQLEMRDVAGALTYLRGRGINEVGTIGWSMGAISALNSAPDHPEMRAIVADSAFADANLLLDTNVPKMSGLPPIFTPGMLLMGRLLYGIDYAHNIPARAVARLGSRPVFLIHGTSDERIPVSHAYLLQKAGANDPNLQLWIVPNACHTCAYRQNPEEYSKRVLAFFDQNLR
jgi:pimeloyl-ACP methyl ester carboxylesterase